MKNIKKSIYSTFLAIIILIIVGYNYDIYNSQTLIEYTVSTAERLDNSPKGIFRQTWRIIKNNFLDKTYNHQDWQKWKKRYENQIQTNEDMHVAVETIVKSLNDPYTRFLSNDDFEEQNRNIDSKLHGIGVHITEIDGKVIIISVIEDAPAEKSGLKEKDKIIKIDSLSAKGLSLREVAKLIRGKKGTIVKLTILRGEKTLVKTVKRDEIKIKTVKYELFDNDIAYIKISSFISFDTANELEKALYSTIKAKGIIIDVRENYGGLLGNAVSISNMFIKNGTIVSIVDRNTQKQIYRAMQSEFITQKPLVVLINGSSASASEIFGGAIQDHKRGILVGETTFGKGKVQKIFKLADGSGVNMTIAKYLTPNGTDIDHKGIKPDYKVEQSKEDIINDKDPQLDMAIEILLGKLQGK